MPDLALDGMAMPNKKEALPEKVRKLKLCSKQEVSLGNSKYEGNGADSASIQHGEYAKGRTECI